MATTIPSLFDVAPPPGWEPVAELCRAVFEDRQALTSHINDLIFAEIEEFREGPFTKADLDWSTGTGIVNFLRGVAECRDAKADDLDFQREVGRRTAVRGFPLQPLISSFQVGFRELWSTLSKLALRSGGPASSLMLERGSIVWERLVGVTSAVAEGYQLETARRTAAATTATAHFIEALEQDPTSDESITLARDLGFSVDGSFRIVKLSGQIVLAEIARDIVTRLHAGGATVATAQHGRAAVVIMQGADDETLVEALDAVPAQTAVGIGAVWDGLAGARASMAEAESALALSAMQGRSIRFDDEWLLAVLLAERGSIERLIAPGLRVAAAKPHLAAAVSAFSASGYSIAEGARRLQISANSFRYRLERWHSLTGWDVMTFGGLARSMVALGLLPQP